MAAELYCKNQASLSVLALLVNGRESDTDRALAEGLARIIERRQIGELDELKTQVEVAKLLSRGTGERPVP